MGGHDGVSYLKSVECYSPNTNEWTQVASMNARRGGVAVGCIGGHIYATGGYNDTSNLNTTGTNVELFYTLLVLYIITNNYQAWIIQVWLFGSIIFLSIRRE